jgi:hypothetical protein
VSRKRCAYRYGMKWKTGRSATECGVKSGKIVSPLR